MDQAQHIDHELAMRFKRFQQMGRHDLQSYLFMAAPDELPEEALDQAQRQTLGWMNRRLAITPFEFLTAPDDFYFFMRKAFQYAESYLWEQAWNRSGEKMDECRQVLDSWLDGSGYVEDAIVREFAGETLSHYRIAGESYAIPSAKGLKIAKAMRRSLLREAERHSVRHLFTDLPDDPTPEECK